MVAKEVPIEPVMKVELQSGAQNLSEVVITAMGISKEKKASEGLPKHFIPEAFYKDKFLPKYRYAVEADNKEVIEGDLKNHSILPLEYHYFYYAHSEGPKWLAIKDDISVLGTAHYKSKYPDAGVKAVVVSYAIEKN